MALVSQVVQEFSRGATLQFATTFRDVNGAVTQPIAAVLHVNYQGPPPGFALVDLEIPMVAPTLPSVIWTALWDTRNVGEGLVAFSIRSSGGPTFAVQDGVLKLSSNVANQQTFS